MKRGRKIYPRTIKVLRYVKRLRAKGIKPRSRDISRIFGMSKAHADQLVHFEHAMCRRMTTAAIKKGILKRPACCQKCKQKHPRIEGHHPDYSDHIRVIWLCSPCHRKIATVVKKLETPNTLSMEMITAHKFKSREKIRIKLDGCSPCLVNREQYVKATVALLATLKFKGVDEAEVSEQIDAALAGEELGYGLSAVGFFMKDELVFK